MLKKLSDEKLAEVLEVGISEFADRGLQQASMQAIAKRAGISVGVLYKYYENKDAFFSACVRHSTAELDAFIRDLCAQEKKPLQYAQAMIGAVQQFSQQHKDYIRLYYEATRTSDRAHAAALAKQIEGVSAKLYTDIIRRAQMAGNVRRDLDPQLFAFFFGNLLMVMQLSYCCPYYEERFKLYADAQNVDHAQLVTEQLLKFLESAFTLEQADIPHRTLRGELL